MKVSKKTLSNGLRVITVPMKDNPTVTVLVLVSVGSKYEEKRINGISHFLEHMCFKGTTKRPRSIDISKELDSIGSSYNAFTSYEYTGYYAKSTEKHFSKIFEIISDIYLNSTLPEKEIQKEKGVILEEINMYKDMPHRFIDDLFTKLLYGDTPVGRNILGKKETVLGLKREDLMKYKLTHYVPEKTVIVVAGPVKEKKILIEVKKSFGNIILKNNSKKEKVKEIQKKPGILLEYKKTDQTHLVLGFRTFGLFDKRNTTVSVLSSILSGGMSSRLFEKLREEMGVGYYLNAMNNPFTDHGFFSISTGVDTKRVEEVITVLLEECKKIKSSLVAAEELKRAKEILIANMKFALESTDDVANYYGGQELLKREMLSPNERIKKIKAVTALDIQKIARQIFTEEKLNLAMIGPFKKPEKFLKFLKF